MAFNVFGRKPGGSELKKVQQSPHYTGKSFVNLEETKMMENESFVSVLWKFMNKPKNTVPPQPLPTVKTDLKNLSDEAPVLVWFGHSSYLLKINGKVILVDPVFSGHASPFSFTTKSFAGTNIYSVDDLPHIDVLLITHDHYDHLDFKTVVQLKEKTTRVCTSLGVAAHFVFWGFDKKNITEFDWWDSHALPGDIQLTAVPARHFSGRTLRRNTTLWSAFVLHTKELTLFLGGDSGYGDHFKTIADLFAPFDLAILECGQYNMAWHHIHTLPEETVQAAIDLKAKVFMPVHWGKFSLALHPWDEPVQRVVAAAHEKGVPVTTPLIGESVFIGKTYPDKHWWLTVAKLICMVITTGLVSCCFAQTYVSVAPSFTNSAGTIAEKSNLTFEVGQQWDVFSLGVDAGKTTLAKISGRDTSAYIELRPNLNVFQQGKFTNTFTAGIGYVFNAREYLLTELTNGIEYAFDDKLHFNIVFGQYFYSGRYSESDVTFFGVSAAFYFTKTNVGAVFKKPLIK